MFNEVYGVGLMGMNAYLITVEITITKGMPNIEIVGLPDLAVQESKARVRSAIENSGILYSEQHYTINLAPASVKKYGAMFDLPILIAILCIEGELRANLQDSAFVGELSLSGELVPVNGALTMALAAKASGIKNLYLPLANALEASVVEGINVYGVKDVRTLFAHLKKHTLIPPQKQYVPQPSEFICNYDFCDVKGQENVKKAFEIAAAGSHNILMIGPPGTGKSMIAKCIPSILPRMSFDESIETTQIHSVAGILNLKSPLVVTRPFRDVSNTASVVGLVGGGSIPHPGEISMAHNGVLFLDEFTEFNRNVLETLRQPLENGEIIISRAVGSFTYPCNIMLVAAMNPCPCGNFGHPTKVCRCSSEQVKKYLSRISQPVLDRIDIQVEVPPVSYEEISSSEKSEPSANIAARVQRARDVQAKRFKGTNIKTNSCITPNMLHEVCVLSDEAERFMSGAFLQLGFSGRAYDRILKVSRTVADMDESEKIEKRHIAQAIAYRSLDRKYWGK